MKAVFGKLEKKSVVIFVPMIDLAPTDLTCVYSTLKHIEELTQKSNKVTVCTFDQALWWKALQVLVPPRNYLEYFIIRLGGFHTRMSFLGCIGYVMSNSGMRDALELIYAENAVPYLLSGKAVDSAIRRHQVVYIALHTILIEDIIGSTDIDSERLK